MSDELLDYDREVKGIIEECNNLIADAKALVKNPRGKDAVTLLACYVVLTCIRNLTIFELA